MIPKNKKNVFWMIDKISSNNSKFLKNKRAMVAEDRVNVGMIFEESLT